jgi:hypothetical protein
MTCHGYIYIAPIAVVSKINPPCLWQGSLKSDVSWKVACGANVAYDQFPSQNQVRS